MTDAIQRLLSSIKIEIDGVAWPNTYAEDTQVDRTNLDECFQNQAERYAYWATLAEEADNAYLKCEENLRGLSAALDAENRQKARVAQNEDPKFKMTEAAFANEILLDARYQAKLAEMQRLRDLAKLLKHAPHAFTHRRDMLVQMGAHVRASSNEPRIMEDRQAAVRERLMAKQPPAQPQLPPAGPKTCIDCGGLLGPSNTSKLQSGEIRHVKCPAREPKCDQMPSYCCEPGHDKCYRETCCVHGTKKPWWEQNPEPISGMICGVCSDPVFRVPGGAACRNGHGGAEVPTPPSAAVANARPAAPRRRPSRTA